LGIILLAVSTGLLAIGATTHILMGDHEKKRLMFIPIVIFVIVMIAVPILTISGVSDFRDALDELEVAETESDVEKVARDINAIEFEDVILGSQIGGLLNLVNIILVFVFFKKLKPIPMMGEGGFQMEAGNVWQPAMAPQNYQPQYQAPQQYPCNTCGQPLQFIDQYQRYYCSYCQQYK
jgi:hypothetical protein